MRKYLDSTGLAQVWNKIKSAFLSTSGGAITGNLGVQGDLNVLGDATFNEGTLYAQSIVGNLDGTASKALGDGQGQQINTTYIKDIDVRGLPFIITKGDGSTYSQKAGYLYENTGKKDWVHLGTFNTNIQGDGGEIWLFGGAGQNGNPSQHMWAHLFIKQGYQATASTKERYAATYEIFCKKDDATWYYYAHMKFKVLCKEIGKVDVWAYFGHECSRCYYYPAGRYDSFVPSNELLSSEPTDESIYGVEQPISGGFVIPSKKGYSVDDMLPLTGGTVTGNLGVSGTLYTDQIKGYSENSTNLTLGTGDNSGYIWITDDMFGKNENGEESWSIGANTGYATFSGVSQTSDQRLKENIHDVDKSFTEKYWATENGLIHEYDWIKSGKHANGMIAQELLNYIPEAVNHNVENDTYSVDYTSATCKMMGAMFLKIKELENEIVTIKKIIEKLKNNH